jgi:hypothetical protein
MNKKLVILIIVVLLLCGCKGKEKTIYEYYVTVDDVDIKVNRLFNFLSNSLGNYNDIKYLNQGDNIIYIYNDIEIETYKKDNEEKVLSFWFTSDKYNTNEGVRIGDNIDKMLYVYGDNYEYNNDVYIYKLNNSSVSFIVENDIIKGIEYSLV